MSVPSNWICKNSGDCCEMSCSGLQMTFQIYLLGLVEFGRKVIMKNKSIVEDIGFYTRR